MSKKRRATRPRRRKQGEPGDVHVSTYEITWEPIYDRRYRRLPEHVKESLEELHHLSQEKPREAIPELLKWIEKYPNMPMLYNYLSGAYSAAGESEKAEEAIRENYRRNPNYLFARLNYAELCLNRHEYDKVAEIFDHKFDLRMLYPKRRQFHISEAVGFLSVMGLYFLGIGQRDTAEKYHEILVQIAPDHPATVQLRMKLLPGFFERLLGWTEKTK